MEVPAKSLACAALLFATCLPACRKAAIDVYETPKRSPSPSSIEIEAASSKATVTWIIPKGWRTLPPTAYSKTVLGPGGKDEARIHISSFPSAASGLAGYVNRWRAEMGQPPASPSQIENSLEEIFIDSRLSQAIRYREPEADGAAQGLGLRAVATPYLNQVWFISLRGTAEAIDAHSQAFDDFLGTLNFSAQGNAELSIENTATKAKLSYEIPEGWENVAPRPAQAARFHIAKPGLPTAELIALHFKGHGGGALANINRWRSQLGLKAWNASTLQQKAQYLDASDSRYVIYDLMPESTGQRGAATQRMLIAHNEKDGDSWYFKLKGDALLLDTQRQKFNEFLGSISLKPANQEAAQ